MNHYQKLAIDLLKYELSPKKDHHCISLYQPNNNFSKAQISQHLKSLLLKALRSKKQLKHASNEDQIIQEVQDCVMNLDQLLTGVAIFFRIKIDGSKLQIVNSSLHCLPLGHKPVSEYFAGGRYSVEQLMMIANAVTDGLVLDLKRNEYFLYKYSQEDVIEIDHKENDYIEEDIQRYIEKYSPDGLNLAIHGTGADKYQKRLLKQNELFLKDVIEKVKDYPSPIGHLLVFYSNWFSPFIQTHLDDLDTSLPKTHLVAVDKNIKKRELFIEQVKKELEKHIGDKKEKLLDELKQQHHLIVETWPEIAKAASNGQIRRLLIKPNISVSGYITTDGLVYTDEPQMESKKVDNIVPWIVAVVSQQDGEVHTFKPDELDGRPRMLAQLRY